MRSISAPSASPGSSWRSSRRPFPRRRWASGKPDVVHQQFANTGADLGVVNICGDPADFAFSTKGSFTSVDMADGVFHVQVASRGTYTVTFLDTSKGVW